MSTIIDQYIETASSVHSISTLHPSNYTNTRSLAGTKCTGNGLKVTQAKFLLIRHGSATASIQAQIFEKPPSTWFPLSNPVAVSDVVSFNNIPSSPSTGTWVDFNFTGANQVILTQGKIYLVCVVCISSGLSNLETTAPFIDVRIRDTTVATTQYMSVMCYNKGWRDNTFGVGQVSIYLYQLFGVPASGYSVTYNGNGNTGGTAPTDANSPYASGATVIVLGPNNLTKTDHTFIGWATSSGGSVAYTQNQTFAITSNTTLYAVWQYSGGGGFNGGSIDNPLTIKHNYVKFTNSLRDVLKWMYWEKTFAGGNPFATIGGNAINAVGLRLKDNVTNKWTDVFGSLLYTDQSDTDPRPGFAVNDHLYVRRDFFARGQLNSMEGAIMLYGNGYDSANSSRPDWWIGWGPRVGTPFIYLAQGGAHKPAYWLGGNPAAETLLITTNAGGTGSISTNLSSAYSYGDIELRNLKSHGTINAENLTVSGKPLSIQSGSGTTTSQSTGVKIIFNKAFKQKPAVTVTVRDEYDSTRPILLTVTR